MVRTFVTNRERRVVEALTVTARYHAIPTDRLGITQQNIDTTLTYVFDKFMDALRLMADVENTNTFKSRIKKNNDEIIKLILAIRKNCKKASEK